MVDNYFAAQVMVSLMTSLQPLVTSNPPVLLTVSL